MNETQHPLNELNPDDYKGRGAFEKMNHPIVAQVEKVTGKDWLDHCTAEFAAASGDGGTPFAELPADHKNGLQYAFVDLANQDERFLVPANQGDGSQVGDGDSVLAETSPATIQSPSKFMGGERIEAFDKKQHSRVSEIEADGGRWENYVEQQVRAAVGSTVRFEDLPAEDQNAIQWALVGTGGDGPQIIKNRVTAFVQRKAKPKVEKGEQQTSE